MCIRDSTYADEIKTPFYGEGLDGLLHARSNSLRGIVNGIDYNDFNPETDINPVSYTHLDVYKRQDFNRELSSYMDDMTFDESVFYETERRLDLLNGLKAKYGQRIEEKMCIRDRYCTWYPHAGRGRRGCDHCRPGRWFYRGTMGF